MSGVSGMVPWSTCAEETVSRMSERQLADPHRPCWAFLAHPSLYPLRRGWLAQVYTTVFANPAKGAPYRCLVWESVQTLVPKVHPPLLDSGLSQ